MIERRQLTRKEVEQIVKEAAPTETYFIRSWCETYGLDPFDFLGSVARYQAGLVIDGRPVYLMSVVQNECWTVVNRSVNEQYTLFKTAKEEALWAAQKFGFITATMLKEGNEKNLRWTERIGFVRVSEDEDTVTLELSGGRAMKHGMWK